MELALIYSLCWVVHHSPILKITYNEILYYYYRCILVLVAYIWLFINRGCIIVAVDCTDN